MAVVVAPSPLSVTAEAGRPAQPSPPPDNSVSFHEVLSTLNPLQYVPVVGTIYRAVTGDTVSEPAHMIGSFVFSGLTGGPVGVATTVASTFFEKITGIDPERIGRSMLASIGIGHADPAPAATTQIAAAEPAPAAATAAPVPSPAGPEPSQALSRTQLAAYGVTQTPDGLRQGALAGADVLNAIQLARIGTVQATAVAAAYATPSQAA